MIGVKPNLVGTSAPQRKTKDPCPGCRLHRERCLCHLIPKFDLKTRHCLVIHKEELKRTTNTGQLALRALVNSEMRVRGEGTTPMDLSDLLGGAYQPLLFYPSTDAQEVTPQFLRNLERPICLIVPDGNWRQASKVHTRQPELRGVPRVMIKAPNLEKYHLRAESSAEGMATLQAIATIFTFLEGPEVGRALMDLYHEKLRRTLEGRGLKLENPV